MELSKNVYNLRKEKGLSQEKLAEQINVSRQTISNWELGETMPNPEQLKLLSKALGMSIDNLVGNDNSTKESSKINGEALKSVYKGCAILTGSIGLVWSLTANRFHLHECLIIAILFAVAGLGIGLVIHGIVKLLKYGG